MKTEQLVEGMVVAEDVKNLDNMLLIPAGCALSERHINILQSWGIAEVDVKLTGDAAAAADPIARLSAEELQKLKAEVRACFHQLDPQNEAADEVFRVMLHRRARSFAAS